ncbi:MAG: alpha/beta fold hydrolase [Saprospiraceae bacterium]|nr:alpha/beta fold hydrolase [Saprospiraceae bacterium]
MLRSALVLMILFPVLISAQDDRAGRWQGTLTVQGLNIDILFHLTIGDAGWECTMDVPLQGLKDFAATGVSVSGDSLEVNFGTIPAAYQGLFATDNQTIKGNWLQNGQVFPLNLERTEAGLTDSRPQEPRPPFPYQSVDITFPSYADTTVVLAGTLTYPDGVESAPGVVLVSGSGPQDRNEEIMGHKPFLVLADYLTRRGIAVLRYDDRGVGASGGQRNTSTVADFAEDAHGALHYLRTQDLIQCRSAGVIGHSEGGMVASILGAQKVVDFIVTMAGPGTPIDELLVDQTLFMDKVAGHPDEAIKMDTSYAHNLYDLVKEAGEGELDLPVLRAMIEDYYHLSEFIRQQFPSLDQFTESQIQLVSSPWFRHFVRFVPQDYFRQVTCPVLALNGSLDFQVPAEKNLRAIEQALIEGPCVDFEIRQFPGLNHLFQPAQTGHLDEYARIPITIAPQVLETIADWILKR